jgi:uncharacterized membrane protein YqaE (UPF0057 family)
VFTILYLIAILFPPLAVLLAGKPIQAVLNLVLTLFFYVPGLIHAILVVHDKKADKRMKQQAAFIAKLKRTTK